MPHRVLFLPGSVLPGDLAYSALVAALGDRAESRVKELELYRGDEPPIDYTLDTEVEGILHATQDWDQFNLVGYSGGGASTLAFAAKHGYRLLSLGLLEPAWAGSWDWSPAHKALWDEYVALEGLAPPEFMARFRELGVAPGVPAAAPPGPPPPWMAKRPAGIMAFMRTFATYDLSREALAAFDKPVYFALGKLSNQDDYGEIASRLAGVFPDFTLELYDERHHFDPPHRVEPERLAQSLLNTWDRAA